MRAFNLHNNFTNISVTDESWIDETPAKGSYATTKEIYEIHRARLYQCGVSLREGSHQAQTIRANARPRVPRAQKQGSLSFQQGQTGGQAMTPNDAFYEWERKNNHQDMSQRDRIIWISGYIDALKMKSDQQLEQFFAKHEASQNNK